jgi:nucleoside-diphosphate-sugar epimerase
MKIFLTGATGFIGGSLAHQLVKKGHEVYGLVRSQEKASALEQAGVQPVIGTLDHDDTLIEAARQADAVFNVASSDHRGAVEALIQALAGSEKPFIHTSGSSIVCDDARGDFANPKVYHDDSFIQPIPMREARYAIDRFVRAAGIALGVRAIVLCPTMIYGTGRGLQKDSDQIPKLMGRSSACRIGVHIGKGLNRWSNVYIDDMIDLYLLALEKAPSGSFFFAENGEESLRDIAVSISNALGFGGKTESWKADDAIAEYGDWARFALASNSRVRANNARSLLGWSPKGPSLLKVIEEGETR